MDFNDIPREAPPLTEIERLREENEKLKVELDILRKDISSALFEIKIKALLSNTKIKFDKIALVWYAYNKLYYVLPTIENGRIKYNDNSFNHYYCISTDEYFTIEVNDYNLITSNIIKQYTVMDHVKNDKDNDEIYISDEVEIKIITRDQFKEVIKYYYETIELMQNKLKNPFNQLWKVL